MAEAHITAAHVDGRDSAARNGLPERKPYVASERAAFREPPEVTAARERHRVLAAEIDRARAALEARLDAMAEAAREARERDG
jgi:hypothetical protein